MPIREYECSCGCGKFESLEGLNAKKKPPCPQCGRKTQRIPSTFGMSKGSTLSGRRARDEAKEVNAIKEDLKTNYGVHKIQPVPNSEGRGVKQIYKDIKKLGSQVPESMEAERIKNTAATKAKQAKWMEGALKRTEARKGELDAKRAKKVAAQKA